jgi:hypothetical protein
MVGDTRGQSEEKKNCTRMDDTMAVGRNVVYMASSVTRRANKKQTEQSEDEGCSNSGMGLHG